METEFAEAFLHRGAGSRSSFKRKWEGWSGHVVLGRRLKAFSLWHEFLLEAIESPLVRAVAALPREEGAEALARAVSICRCGFGEWDVAPVRGLRVMWRLMGRGLEAELSAFREYVRDYQVLPAYTI